VGVNLLLNP